MKNIKIGFNKSGVYPNKYIQAIFNRRYKYDLEIDNYKFSCKIQYMGYDHSRSTTHIFWESLDDDKIYIFTMGMLNNAIKDEKLNNKIIDGTFCFKKRGLAIFLDLVEYN